MKLGILCWVIVLSGLTWGCSADYVLQEEVITPIEKEEECFTLTLKTQQGTANDSANGVIGIEDGYVILVEETKTDFVLAARIYFTHSDINDQGLLNLKTNITPNKYLLFVVANPTMNIRKQIESSNRPWEIQIEAPSTEKDYRPDFSELIHVMTNDTQDYPFIGKGTFQQKVTFYPGESNKPVRIVVPLYRVVSMISLNKTDVKFGGQVVADIDESEFEFFGFTLINLAKRTYLWPHWNQLPDNFQNWVPMSPYRGVYHEDYYMMPLSKIVYLNMRTGYITFFTNNNHTHRRFSLESQYLMENIPITYQDDQYEARQWCTTAVIICIHDKRDYLFYSSLEDDGKYHIVRLPAQAVGDHYTSYQGKMYFTYFLKDPNSSLNQGVTTQTYPSVFRSHHYRINLPEIRRIGIDRPGRDLEKPHEVNRNVWNDRSNTTRGIPWTEISEEYILELEVVE